MGDSGVAEDVVIARGEHKDPDTAIPPDLVVGEGSVSDLGVGPSGRQAGRDEDAVAGVVHHQVLGEGGVGNAGVGNVAGRHDDAVKLRFGNDIVRHSGMRDSPRVVKSPARIRIPMGKCWTCRPVMVL